MKKSVIALWCAAALFLVSSFTLIGENLPAAIFGVALSGVLALVGYSKYKKNKAIEAAEALKKAEAEERRREFEARHGLISVSVAGVTFDNDDGKKRQNILSAIYKESEGLGVEGELERYEYKGEAAIRVLVEDRCIGVIRKSDLPEVLPLLDRVENVSVYVDRFEEDDGKIYRADLHIQYAK